MSYRILIVVSRFNAKVTEALLAGCRQVLAPAAQVAVAYVPGAFELPLMAAKGARSKHWDAVICLGCVIRGETPHFDYICQEAARGLMSLSLETEKPVIFGVLTTDTEGQAQARAGLAPAKEPGALAIKQQASGNKGCEAAQAALEMLASLATWKETHGREPSK